MFTKVVYCDVAVAGGGGAAIRSALTAAGQGLEVAMLSRTEIGQSGSTFYPLTFEWGMLTAEGEEDQKQFASEILSAAGGCINPKLSAQLAERSADCLRRLKNEGCAFVTMKEVGITGCFGKEPRGVFLRDMDTFASSQRRLVAQNEHIQFLSGLTVISLLVADGRTCGLAAVDDGGEPVAVLARSVVLALGGGEGLFRQRTAFGPLYGNAYSLAARRGARVVNLEFIQFVPGTVTPVSYMNYYPFGLCENPRVTNAKGEECLSRYLPVGVSQEECLAERAHHGPFSREGVGKYLDYAMLGESLSGNGMGLTITPDAKRMSTPRYALWRGFLSRFHMDEGTPMAVYPTAQGFNGGVLMNDRLETDIEGLFVCGESSGGLHGPDRMGGLCILATQVFGELAGEAAATYARESMGPRVSQGTAWDSFMADYQNAPNNGVRPDCALETLRDTMQRHAFLRRTEAGIKEGLIALNTLHPATLDTLGTPLAGQCFEVYNAVEAARLVLTAMLNRRESRGSHDRADYEERNPAENAMRWVRFHHNEVQSGKLDAQ